MRKSLIAPGALAAGVEGSAHRVVFAPRGPLALNPSAFGEELLFMSAMEEREPFVLHDRVAVVDVRGPLVHHEECFLESYDALKSRVAAALQSGVKCVLLSIDSPGGLVAGCFDTARELRTMAVEAGVPLYAYVDSQATSAAYAIACAASRIFIPEAGQVGSIGVMEVLIDATQADAKEGVAFTLIGSGERKLDGNPHEPVSDAAVAEVKARVDKFAGLFFELVSEMRPGVSAQSVRDLEARVLIGRDAISAGVADEVATFDEVIARLNAGGLTQDSPLASAGGEQPTTHSGAKGMDPEQIKGILKALAEDEKAPEEDREWARRALAPCDTKPKAEDGDGKDDPEKPEAPTAEGDVTIDLDEEEDEDEEEQEDEEEPAVTAAATAAPAAVKAQTKPQAKGPGAEVLALAAKVQKLEAEASARRRVRTRAKLMASRPDFASEVVAFLEKQPLRVVREACQPPENGGLPRGPGRGGQLAAARAALTGTRPPVVGEDTAMVAGVPIGVRTHYTEDAKRMDRVMGFAAKEPPIVGHSAGVSMRAIKREDALRYLAEQQKAQAQKGASQ